MKNKNSINQALDTALNYHNKINGMKKPLNAKNYGSIPHLSTSRLGAGDHFITEGQERILVEKTRDKNDLIIVTEKYDGSNVGIAKVGGKIYAVTKSGYEAKTSPYLQHSVFNMWVEIHKKMFNEMLEDGDRIIGEWLAVAHGMIYNIEGDPIVFFDYFHGRERALFEELGSKGIEYGIRIPRVIHMGGAISTDYLISALNRKTDDVCSKEDPEGMVYRCERKGKVDFLAKWVRPDFTAGKYLDSESIVWNQITQYVTK